jgi:hypothetical protein
MSVFTDNPDAMFWHAYLLQGTYWVPRDRVPVEVSGMDAGYRRNAAAWLLRRAPLAEMYYTAREMDLLSRPVPVTIGEVDGRAVERIDPGVTHLPSEGSMAADALDDELERRSADPGAWLKTTPLYRALTAGLRE